MYILIKESWFFMTLISILLG